MRLTSRQVFSGIQSASLTCCLLLNGNFISWSSAQALETVGKQGAARPASVSTPLASPQASQQRGQRGGRPSTGVYKSRIVPHWFHENQRFWYVNELAGNTREFIVVDVEHGTRKPAFDHKKLAAGLAKASGKAVLAQKLPFTTIKFTDDAGSVEFDVDETHWKCDLKSYECTSGGTGAAEPEQAALPVVEQFELESPLWTDPHPGLRESPEYQQPPQQGRGGQRGGRGNQGAANSPDGKWTAFVKDGNVFVRSNGDRKETQLSRDGQAGRAYGMLQWAPDSNTVVGWRIEPATPGDVYLVESSPRGGGRAKLHTRPYPLPGDKFTSYELCLFDPAQKKPIKPKVDPVDFGRPRIHWSQDGKWFAYEKVDRGHQRLRLIRVNVADGSTQDLIDEKTDTFIWTIHIENLRLSLVNYVPDSDDIVYVSERDGWRHLYLVDGQKGTMKQITRGDYVLRGIDRIDGVKRQIWFQASGKNPNQDPYFVHFYRVNFDGTGLVGLTEGNGEHSVQYSPDRKFLIDTYSRVDQAPVHTLRRVADGKLVCKLEEADITELQASGWTPPEVFVAKGRDGKTDIWGIICRPKGFDASKKYPVIEQIYAGPQGSFTPKSFSPFRRFANLTDLGFIVVQMDGMGTANRSKAFHDVCWKNLKDAGFPDRILWHQAVAKKYKSYDISRVGITGGSAGGQNSTGGLLFHPDFYKAAVSGCGCHDNRMDKASWNEQWMGYPVGPQYAASSNIDNAHKLRGKLLLIVGEMDSNVPPESTYRLVDALIKAGKDFDYLAVPGANHGMGGAYGTRRLQDFFVRHLQGKELVDRNR
jgi:dipeptidyl aminopeptidase/acylaminoacyl peptidase